MAKIALATFLALVTMQSLVAYCQLEASTDDNFSCEKDFKRLTEEMKKLKTKVDLQTEEIRRLKRPPWISKRRTKRTTRKPSFGSSAEGNSLNRTSAGNITAGNRDAVYSTLTLLQKNYYETSVSADNPFIGLSSQTVAFMAMLGSVVNSPAVGHIITFDQETIDSGNHYNHHTGIFTAPCSGIYYFSLSLTVKVEVANGGGFGANIVRDGQAIAYLFEYTNNGYDFKRSEAVIAHLNTGDSVYVRVKWTAPPYKLYDGMHSHFLGFLLFQDE